ncbi:hypothetical protein [Candidatus Enterococcus willemsii]|uniref:Uncharacterized protein n=1 Tax=Candidatus Enterococcus willemsii TaxID=1857215 RepID=A0ABQ6YWW1_9ENTE|nr:hypothetical protein [Enterococcus sp. CU12B]KAF1302191.1 hypothetical protein BAU17_02110 [Enterococcus sp. CU12B]
MDKFNHKFLNAPEWQQERFSAVFEQLEQYNLSEEERSSLLWLCGFEQSTLYNIMTIIQKVQKG